MDYPNITGVLQFGVPENRDQYIHRLGRTGRAGKEGKGVLILAPFERKFLKELDDLDIPANRDITQILYSPLDEDTRTQVDQVLNKIGNGHAVLTVSAERAYQAFIGYYRGHLKKTSLKNTQQLVDVANEYAILTGLKEIPGIPKKTARKMGILNLPNVRITQDEGFNQRKQGNQRNNGNQGTRNGNGSGNARRRAY